MKYFAAVAVAGLIVAPAFAQTAPRGEELTLYSATGLKGQKRVVTETSPNLSGADADNFAWSLSTKGRWEVCMDAGHRAGCRVVTGDIADLGTDGGAITSARYLGVAAQSAAAGNSAPQSAPARSSPNYVGYVYSTDFNDLTITDWTASSVAGRYEYAGGRIEGTLSGNTLTGYWMQESSPLSCGTKQGGTQHWGRITFTFSADRTSFTGKWSDCGDAPTKQWNGTLIRKSSAIATPRGPKQT